jgi:tRNA-splicing ligase RtcB (3'-phosphate/5'-hydroxy nucleic acid ligase)
MCLALETDVPLASGCDGKLGEFCQSEQVVYCCSSTGRVRMTNCRGEERANKQECVRVTLDNGQQFVCAVTQQILLRDGTYRRADQLEPGTSLMPLYKKLDKEGYVLVQQNYSGRWQKAHWIVARCGLLGKIPKFEGQRTVIHHKDFDPANNAPPNLEFMGANDHSAFHRSLVERNQHFQSPEFEARRVQALSAKALTLDGHAYFAARGTKNILTYMKQRSEHFGRLSRATANAAHLR